MSATSGSSSALADGRVGQRIENYTKFWKEDLKKDSDEDNQHRLSLYTEVVNGACAQAFLLSLELDC